MLGSHLVLVYNLHGARRTKLLTPNISFSVVLGLIEVQREESQKFNTVSSNCPRELSVNN